MHSSLGDSKEKFDTLIVIDKKELIEGNICQILNAR
jgi:hypothetical protein